MADKVKKVQVGYLYKTDGTTEKIIPENGTKFSLIDLQKAVGGYIEHLVSGIPRCKQMYCNEEGMIRNLPANPHTWQVVNAKTYKNSGYPPAWRVQGDIIAILNEEVKENDHSSESAS